MNQMLIYWLINPADPIDYAEHYFDLKFKLENLLDRPIDLLEEKRLLELKR
jgi:predicted nucleotidyltransferase